ncbi:hypothetical protein GJAV_G00205610 [Gymnothorax javanicus]|nr:hypothetical protein GJAV_G00205610 [Gymnothorax javanicus]
MIHKDLPLDDLYAYALSKTLTKVAPPVTVGLYSTCQSRVNMLIKNIEAHMKKEVEEREKKYEGELKPRSKSSATYFLSLFLKMLFCTPVWTKQNQSRTEVRYIFVKFSAWHFAGSDMLWAGLVMKLYESLEENFGVLLIPLYRITQHKEEEKERVIKKSGKDWQSRKICCIPLWLLTILVLTVIVLIVTFLAKCGLPKWRGEDEHGEPDNRGVGVVKSLAIGILGVPMFGVAKFIFQLIKNLIMNPSFNIKSNMNNEKVSSRLGFMNEVWKEMRLISCFIQFMEVFERRNIHVVLQITHLDRCTPKRITGVLDAINILLSDEQSPFISMIAVNPEILVEQLDYADSCFSKEDRARAFLNRTVTLPFSVPKLCDISKRNVFHNTVQSQCKTKHDFSVSQSEFGAFGYRASTLSQDQSSEKSGHVRLELGVPLITKTFKAETNIAFELKEDEFERIIDSAFQCICSGKGDLHKYITGDTISMRRIINSIRVSVIIMKAMHEELPSVDIIAAWVVLADRWPCRLCWILEYLEDGRQTDQLDTGLPTADLLDDSKTLWEVFSLSRLELFLIRDQISVLLEQDGDPELFDLFLKVHFKLTVKDADRFKLATVNLDHSIQKELSRIRGRTARRDTVGKDTLFPLPLSSVISMSTEDVCTELEKFKLAEKYSGVIKDNELNGQALIYSERAEIKRKLQMSMGEWTTFSIRFLGSRPQQLPLPASPRSSSAMTRKHCCPSLCHSETLRLHAHDT